MKEQREVRVGAKKIHTAFAMVVKSVGAKATKTVRLSWHSSVILQGRQPDCQARLWAWLGLESRLQESIGFPATASAGAWQHLVTITSRALNTRSNCLGKEC